MEQKAVTDTFQPRKEAMERLQVPIPAWTQNTYFISGCIGTDRAILKEN